MSCRVQFCGEEPGADGAAERGPAVLGQSDTIQGAGFGAGEGRGHWIGALTFSHNLTL